MTGTPLPHAVGITKEGAPGNKRTAEIKQPSQVQRCSTLEQGYSIMQNLMLSWKTKVQGITPLNDNFEVQTVIFKKNFLEDMMEEMREKDVAFKLLPLDHANSEISIKVAFKLNPEDQPLK